MELCSNKRTNLHNMLKQHRRAKNHKQRFILEIADLKPNGHKSEKTTNVTQSMKNRESVNSDLQESEGNTENGQIENNQKLDKCRNCRLGLECKCCKNCGYQHYKRKEEMKDRVCWFLRPQECRFGKQCRYYHPNMVEVDKLQKSH